jgi:hypothetical protein
MAKPPEKHIHEIMEKNSTRELQKSLLQQFWSNQNKHNKNDCSHSLVKTKQRVV